ncbi:unnamed protein product [Effrenium voratum]|nr:unnamed protein product [Effrenium voratum]
MAAVLLRRFGGHVGGEGVRLPRLRHWDPVQWPVFSGVFRAGDMVYCHEELLSKNLVVRRQEGFFCIFVSHQWLGIRHPDPERQQLQVLQAALRFLMAGGEVGLDIRDTVFTSRHCFSEQRARLKERLHLDGLV